MDFAKQIFGATHALQSMSLTHCDLKPENILLVNDEMTLVNGIYTPVSNQVKFIDFGGATYEEAIHSSIICTR
jgi:serine/threonine protein kinase